VKKLLIRKGYLKVEMHTGLHDINNRQHDGCHGSQ
jgi:hypothetical protein